MKSWTNILFAVPGRYSGAARVLDIAGTFDDWNSCPTPETADRSALTADMLAVGEDLRTAVQELAEAAR